MTRKLKVAMVASCPFPANHGTPGAIRELSQFLAGQGHEVHVVTYPQFQEGIDTSGLIIHRATGPGANSDEIVIGPSKSRIFADMYLVPKLISVVRKYKIDVIHPHNYEAAIAAGMARLVTGVPMVYNGINSMADELPTYEALKPKALFAKFGRFLDYVVPRMGNASMVLTDELKDYLIDEMGMAEDRVFVIPPGVDPEMFTGGDGAAVRRQFNLSESDPLILYTGAIEGFQRVDLAIAALAPIVEQIANAKLMIAGNISNEKAKAVLMQQATQLGVADNLIFADQVSLDDLPSYLAAADVALSPRTACPGYPIKLLNYMAAGKAIVSFEGSAKALCHGYNGYVAKDEDIADFAAGVVLLLTNKEYAQTLGQRAKETIMGNFDWDSIARATAKIYQHIVESGRVDVADLRDVVKKSYVPELKNARQEGFLQDGPLHFPSYE